MDSEQSSQNEALQTAHALQSNDEHEQALEYFDLALKADPENAQILWEKGYSYEHLGLLAEAQACWEEAARREAKFARLYQAYQNRVAKISEISECSSRNEMELTRLIELAGDEDYEVQGAACQALIQLAEQDIHMIPTLVAKLNNAPPSTHQVILQALSWIDSESTVQAIHTALLDVQNQVQIARPGENQEIAPPHDNPLPPRPVLVPGTKRCAKCGEVIKAEARSCSHCNAQFIVTIKGQCPQCHRMMDADETHLCIQCGAEVISPIIASVYVPE